MKLKPLLARRFYKKSPVLKTQLEKDVEEQLRALEQIREQKEELYIVNAQTFEALSQLEDEEQICLNMIKRLAHTTKEPSNDLNMMTSKTARLAEGQKFVVEVSYRRAADTVNLKALPNSILSLPGMIKSVNVAAVRELALNDKDCAKAIVKGGWSTPSVSVKRLEDATPLGGDPKYVNG